MTPATRWKIAGAVFGCIPLGFFLLFAIGEGAAGWSHYLQVLLSLAVIGFAWWKPSAGGWILIALGVGFGAAYVTAAGSFSLLTIALVELIAFAPAIASGLCFLRAARKAGASGAV